MAARYNFLDYLKLAFFNRWNLLGLGGAAAAACIAFPLMPVTLPLIAAVEIAFVTLVASNPRFQRSMDAQAYAAESARSMQNLSQRFNQLYYALADEAQKKFNQLRERCEILRPTLQSDAEPPASEGLDIMSNSQLKGVNRLLWVYLKLLHTRATLDKFLKATDEKEIVKLEQNTKERLAALPKEGADEITEKKRSSLKDTLNTATARLDNLNRAKSNHEYVELELERIAAKLTALSEMAINRQDPAAITTEVEDVARSVESTEQAIGDLQKFTGFTAEDIEAPPILSAPPQRVRV